MTNELKAIGALHDTLEYLCREIAALRRENQNMSDTFTQALANLAAANNAEAIAVQAEIAALATEVSEVTSLTGSLSTSQAPTADQIAQIQAAADAANARAAAMTASLPPAQPPAGAVTDANGQMIHQTATPVPAGAVSNGGTQAALNANSQPLVPPTPATGV